MRRFFNRELSWLDFNERVLEEASDATHPLLERVKFLSIFHSNLDEFFMIRVSGLQEQVDSGLVEPSIDGMTARSQLAAIRTRARELLARAWRLLQSVLEPELRSAGICFVRFADLSDDARQTVTAFFESTLYPVLTPLAVDPGHPFPHISNLSLSLAVAMRDRRGASRFARVKIPQTFPRLLRLEGLGASQPETDAAEATFLWLEDVVASHLERLFKGMQIGGGYAFRVVRDADLEIREDEAGDLLQSIEHGLVRRRFGSVSQLAVAQGTPAEVRALLTRNLEIDAGRVYEQDGPLGLSDLMGLMRLDRPELRDEPFRPRTPAAVRDPNGIFAAIRKGDILLHHPYDSFTPVIDMIRAAATDPDVLAIKQTIYRVGSDSPIVHALAEASHNRKQVSVLVELKARFDEENNIEWARALERAGVHVVYGDIELKTHCKALMVVRQEADAIRRYVHLGTGNYNARTAAVYTDLGLLTCDPVIADDVTSLFNALTGYSVDVRYERLLVSPEGIRAGLISRIRREMEHAKSGRQGHMILKANSLTDLAIIEALYEASAAGVGVELFIRGSCCLVPGVAKLSESISVRSIVGRFLEHHRVYYFRNGGGEDQEVWLGSADLMARNLDRRVETLFPIQDPLQKRNIVREILAAYQQDRRRARILSASGSYVRPAGYDAADAVDAQMLFMGKARLEEPTQKVKRKATRKIRVQD